MSLEPPPITTLLHEWRSGNRDAGNRLIEIVYGELHRAAARHMRRERGDHTLQATAVVHETYLRLGGAAGVDWKDRAHFFAVAGQQMRRVLVDHARRSRSEKRGGAKVKLPLEECDGQTVALDDRVLAVDEALSRLETLDPRAARAVELRFFAGLSEADAAEALEVSIATLKRDWDFARTWLATQLGSG
jgi:RNA polymerase sigma factor (TIGR02999 family)